VKGIFAFISDYCEIYSRLYIGGNMLFKGFQITEHKDCFVVSNVHGVVIQIFKTLEDAVKAISDYGVAEMNLIADE
jgi:hypothetical protein